MGSDHQRLRVALLTAGGLLVALAVSGVIVGSLTSLTGTDTPGWLPPVMIIASVAGYLAVLLGVSEASGILGTLLLPMLGAVAAFLVTGGVLFGLGGGDPLRGPVFALGLFTAPGVYLVAALSVLAATIFWMGSPPHRGTTSRSIR